MESKQPDTVHETPGGVPRRSALQAAAALFSAPFLAQPAGAAVTQMAASPKRNQRFDEDWRFLRADAPGAELPAFNDTSWRALSLPHDWSVEDLPPRPAHGNGEGILWGAADLPTRVGPFDTDLSAGGRDTGWFVGGTGWYRKHFHIDALPAGGQVEIVFDGVYMNSDVWLNGHLLGNQPYGYTTFAYDLTPHLSPGGVNVLAVRVRNEGRNSRWYSGSGIYRHVWLNTTGSVRIPTWSLFVTTPEVSRQRAAVKVSAGVENRTSSTREVTVHLQLFDGKAPVSANQAVTLSVAAGATATAEHTFTLDNPKLWSTGTPHLYRAEAAVLAAGAAADSASTSFGLRRVEIDVTNGLRINGEAIKLKGGCLHHDNGLLGACAIDRAEERRIELMKANGFNAIRTSHNPPSPAFLDACDRLGMLVLDEAFDQWQRQKNPQDYHQYFDKWWQHDLDAMILRDRNHPCVFLWSIGNEIPERAEPAGVETAKRMVERIRQLDPTRLVTSAISGAFAGSESLDPAFIHLDVGGYNYMWGFYEKDHARHPERIILGTESFPQQAFQNWQLVEKHPYVLGDFVWTGMDHLGESSIGNAQLTSPGRGGPPNQRPAQPSGFGNIFTGLTSFGNISLPFPWFNCYCGDIDLIGQLKPQGYYRRILWGLSKLEMAVQRPVPAGQTESISAWGWSDELRSWTWPGSEGKTLKVRVYTTGDKVSLLLNGAEIASKPVSPETQLTAEFDVPYRPGTLKAVAYQSGKPISELAFQTTGKPARLKITADRAEIRRDRNDLSFVTVEVVDAAGLLVPDTVIPVAFSVSGAGELAAAGSANPKDPFSFRKPRPKTFHGQCLAILRPKGTAGSITLQAQAEGLAGGTVSIRVL
ncbi:glycoside hydrolase family 2 TIM barrel-domain containing protein [Paludibaculum fermentans]|uniref:glycoside hydrolase family 2 TIM barrel-domain containing protein n=1 Tax=Paludibaculum fermentans TaxID=1473598 RepID=UPI003EBBD580